MNDKYLHNLTTNELLRHVDRKHPEVNELAERLELYRDNMTDKHVEDLDFERANWK